MAKFPYTVSGTSAINPDSSVTITVTLKTAAGALVNTGTITFPAGSQPTAVLERVFGFALTGIHDDLADADLPATFSFNLSPADLIR